MFRDATGYAATARELVLVEVAEDALKACEDQMSPLGLDEREWTNLRGDLRRALADASVTDAHAALRGTAARFFSDNPDKVFPATVEAVRDQAMMGLDEEAARAWLAAGYGPDGPKPGRHFWDSRLSLKSSDDPSDYDIELVSNELGERVLRYAKDKGIANPLSQHGGGLRTRYVFEAVPELETWSGRWTHRINRKVNVSGFADPPPQDWPGWAIDVDVSQ